MFNKISSKILLTILRLSLGWLFFYAGITKVLNPNWSAGGYLQGAKTFSDFYLWLASSDIVGMISLINQWSLTLLGISLILGVFVRLSSSLGIALMFLYYLPTLEFPLVGSNNFLVDSHVIYMLILALFVAVKAGRIWGIDGWLVKKVHIKGLNLLS